MPYTDADHSLPRAVAVGRCAVDVVEEKLEGDFSGFSRRPFNNYFCCFLLQSPVRGEPAEIPSEGKQEKSINYTPICQNPTLFKTIGCLDTPVTIVCTMWLGFGGQRSGSAVVRSQPMTSQYHWIQTLALSATVWS